MTLQETGNILEQYRANEKEIETLRDQKLSLEKYIHENNDLDDQISKINKNKEELLETDKNSYSDGEKFLKSIVDAKFLKKIYQPAGTNEHYDEFFFNTYNNYMSFRKAKLTISIVDLALAASIAVLIALFMKETYKWFIVGGTIVLALGIYILIETLFYRGLKRMASANLVSIKARRDNYSETLENEATEKIERIRYTIELEIERKENECILKREEINKKISDVRAKNNSLGISPNVLDLYNRLQARDLFISMCKNASENDTLVQIYSTLKNQEELEKVNSCLNELKLKLNK